MPITDSRVLQRLLQSKEQELEDTKCVLGMYEQNRARFKYFALAAFISGFWIGLGVGFLIG